MQGFSTQQPEEIVQIGDGWQVRRNIEQFEKELDDGTTVTEYSYGYINVPLKDPGSREFKKYVRDAVMQAAVVTTTAGNTFNADEKSQERMVRALNVAQLVGRDTTGWVLADNSVATVGMEELSEALGMAMQLQGDVWFL